MTDDKKEVVDLTAPQPEAPQPEKRIVGLDIGTMNIVSAIFDSKNKETNVSSVKNMFLTLENDIDADLSSIDHVEGDGNIYIFGQHALQFANIFGNTPRRPMAKGLISTEEIDAIDVLSLMIENLIGKGNGNDKCIYAIPSPMIDSDLSVIYHERVLNRILTNLGYQPSSISQPLTVIYSQCEPEQFSGISIDFGAGNCNIGLAYRRNLALTFSTARSGDWIDQETAKSLGIKAVGRVTVLKEKELDLTNPMVGSKKEKRVREGLTYYYENLIRYSLKLIQKKFEEIADTVSIPQELPLIVSGGTSKAKGFLEFFRNIFENFEDFPVKIKEIRQSEDPLSAVAEGALIKGLSNR